MSVAETIKTHLALDTLDETKTLHQLGCDSMDIAEIEVKLGVRGLSPKDNLQTILTKCSKSDNS